jgi:putative DNA primase/helicase
MYTEIKEFSILDHLDKLTPTKGKNKYICPVCGGNDFAVGKNGAYHCFNGDCDPKDIREAVSPWDEVKRDRVNPHRRVIPAPRRSKFEVKPAPIPEGKIELARLSGEVTHPERTPLVWDEATEALKYIIYQESDQEKIPLEDLKNNCTITRYQYSSAQWVTRIDYPHPEKPKGYWKTLRPFHTKNGVDKVGKGNRSWDAYRLAEVLNYHAGRWAIAVEGEGCVEAARSLGLVAFTFQGGSWSGKDIETAAKTLKKARAGGIAYFPDNDDAGFKKAEKLHEICARTGVPFLRINPTDLWADIPDHGDVVDWVKSGMEQGWDKEEFIRQLEQQFNTAADNTREEQYNDEELTESPDIPDSLNPNEEFTQFTLNALYGDKPWICADNKLYQWVGTHYRYSKDAIEIRRLADWCNSYGIPSLDPVTQEVTWEYPFAKPSKVKQALEWVKMRLSVDPDLLNPPGLNCTNGVLQIEWNVIEATPTPQWRLIEHTPDLYFTYKPLVKFDPGANPESCDRLLGALDAPQLDIFLKTIAASLDLSTVRQYKGRMVRGLLLKGHGSNGKDTLREIVAMLYGRHGLTGCTLSDFAAYDDGRKFPLARLQNSRVNWASENANTTRLDKIQSLKAFITGDTLSAEGKGRDENEFNPIGVALFNVNDTPKLQGTLEAITSRYGVLTFNKTFKIGADKSKGELEADPRFKYDPNFLQEEVLPAFLNRVLDALSKLMSEGIDYSCTQKALEDIQAENSHLFQFAQDTGLSYEPNSTLTANEIWTVLEEWYLANGTLAYEESTTGKQKAIWMEQANPYDRNVKAANQVLGRFQQLFPKAKRVVVPSPDGKSRHAALKGLGFNSSPPPEEPPPGGEPPPDPITDPPRPNSDPIPDPINNAKSRVPTHPTQFSQPNDKKQDTSDSGNVADAKRSDTPQDLGRVGRNDQISRIAGSVTGSVTGSETEQTGSEDMIAPDQNTSGENAIADATPTVKLAIGTKVRLNLPGSVRHKKQGIVIRSQEQNLVVRFDDYDLRKDLRVMECCLSWLTTDLESPLPDKAEPQPKPPAPPRIVKPKPEPVEPVPTSYDDVISAIDIELNRLGWTAYQARTWLNGKYGVRSRQLLSDEQLLELLETLKAMPTDTPIGKWCAIKQIVGSCLESKLEKIEGMLIDEPFPPIQTFWRFLIEKTGELYAVYDSDWWEVIEGF